MSTPSQSPDAGHGEVRNVPTRGVPIHYWARFYDIGTQILMLGRETWFRRKIVTLAGVRAGDRVLDIGSGTGALTLAAREAAGPSGVVYGIDPSKEMVAVARRKAERRHSDVHFESGAAEKLRFGDGEFDIVVSSLVLHHLPADVKAQAFAEIRRVLVPGGRFFALDLQGRHHGFLGHIFALHSHAGGADETSPLLASAGFAGVESGAAGFRGLMYWRATKPSAESN